MLSAQENEILTRTGSGTPMGRMMRRFWLPICSAHQVAEPDGPPLRTQLLGEHLVVFRDSSGNVGVLDEFCVHRRASLALGRNEGGGLRCLLHGWKFTREGTILETPNHSLPNVREKIRQPSHPVLDEGGLVWTYIGELQRQPPFQRYGWFDSPEENYVVLRINTPANYLQLYEGGADSAHVGALHMNMMNPGWKNTAFVDGRTDQDGGKGWGADDSGTGHIVSKTELYMSSTVFEQTPSLEIEDTSYGFQYAALREAEPAKDGSSTWSVRITPIMLPTGRIIPANAFQFYVFEVPMNDQLTATYLVFHGPEKQDRQVIIDTMGLSDPKFWTYEDCYFRADWADRLGQDRTNMDRNWSGFAGIEQEDSIIAMSMQPIVDRTKEYLVPSDEAVIRLRRRLLQSVELNEVGKEPLGLDIEDYSNVAAVPDTLIPQSGRWQDLAQGIRKQEPAGLGSAAE
ncbi:MAG: Rieske 2Fe-2S domain-containing protein [Pseudomonadota bacterium]|nr:Rieske 2Fe-2S domain-containing protein [Pseudomonadota bacterium]